MFSFPQPDLNKNRLGHFLYPHRCLMDTLYHVFEHKRVSNFKKCLIVVSQTLYKFYYCIFKCAVQRCQVHLYCGASDIYLTRYADKSPSYRQPLGHHLSTHGSCSHLVVFTECSLCTHQRESSPYLGEVSQISRQTFRTVGCHGVN